MRYRLMDILICPVCKNYPLELHVFEVAELKHAEPPKEACSQFCSYKNINPQSVDKEGLLKDCERCVKIKIKYGLIVCNKCGRWYPITDEIPVMLGDSQRNPRDDLNFLKLFEKQVPTEILYKGKPTHL